MNINDFEQAIHTVVEFVQAYAQHIAAGAGAVGMLLAAYAIRRFTKKREHDDIAATLGVVLFGVVTTEGMWEVVHNKLGVNIGLTIAMFAAFDVVIYSQGRLAIRKLTANPKARVGTYLAIIWALSFAASMTVSTAGGNLTTQLFRFFSPLVAAALWTQKVLELRNGKAERVESNWIWTPTRIMVEKGWMKPGAAENLDEVFAKRRVAALVDAALDLDAAKKAAEARGPEAAKASRWRRRRDPLAEARRRVQRLTKAAAPVDMEAARKQLQLVLTAEEKLFRDDNWVNDAARDALDGVRLITRQAVDRVRTDHARAFGVPPRTIGGIRMPAAIADQIPDQIPDQWVDRLRSNGVDHARSSERTNSEDQAGSNGVDQKQSNPGAAVQPTTSAVAPAVQTTPKRAATVRGDRTKPVSPAAGGDVPPRIRDMVRDLKRTYRGEIPGRRTVMNRMGWTSAGDAQTAINLVRAERSNNAEK